MISHDHRRLDRLVLISGVVLILAVSRSPQGLFSDPGWQLKAVQQSIAGESSSPNRLVLARASDLSRDEPQWIFFWAPGPVLLTYPLMRLGLSVGHAVRTISAVALIVGALGWMRWFRRFEIPRALAVALALALPWVHDASHILSWFSAEILVFAAAPWLLVMTVNVAERLRYRDSLSHTFAAGLVGLALGFAYWLKYSAALVSLGAVIFLCFYGWRQAATRRENTRRLVAAALGAAVPILVLNGLNVWLGRGANPVAVGGGFQFHWEALLALAGNPALAMADADGLWSYILLHPVTGITTSHAWLSVIGLPGGIAMAWLLRRAWTRSSSHMLAIVVFGTAGLALACIWAFSAVSFEARHLTAASMAVLPAVVEAGCLAFAGGTRLMRLLVGGLGVFYLALPAGYGVAAVGASVHRTDGYRVGLASIYNPLLAVHDARAISADLSREVRGPQDVWYFTDPLTPLDVPGRAIVRHADFMAVSELREIFTTTSPVRIHALLPSTFEANGKGAAIRGSFVHASQWTSRVIDGSPYVLWTAAIAPS